MEYKEFLETKKKKFIESGFDVADSEVGIIAGLDSKTLPMIQRVGRLLRLSENKVGKIFILYVRDSQEQKWLENAVSKLNNVQWLNSIEDVLNLFNTKQEQAEV